MRLSIPTLVNIRILGIPALLSILALLPIQGAHAITTEALRCTPEYQIVQTFSNHAKWEMCWEPRGGYGYQLTQVIFTPPNGIRRKILDLLHLSQLFVPYDDNNVRFFDISYGTNLAVLTEPECPSGVLLTNSTLCLVYRPTGYLYKNVSAGTSGQGDSFAIFGYFGLGNYYYTFQYTFSDDGSIDPAVLASGSLQKYGATATTGWPVGNGTPIPMAVNHNHFAIWRMDFDLDGKANNLVERISFTGTPGSDNRTMTVTPLTVETKETNNLATQTFWRVRNTAQNNSDGRNISYEIEPSVTDQLRAPETFTQNDFYLTQYRSTEELVDSGLVSFVNGETVTDVVVWYGVNFHHTPRGEDDFHMPAHSQGFRIRPRDVSIALAAGPVNNPPSITNPGPKTGTVGTAISNLAIGASDPDGNALAFSATGLPPGLAINSVTGVISGTPTTAGSYTALVKVNDGQGGVTSASFAWTVTAGSGVTQIFSAPAAITITDNTTSSPYPANLAVAGMSGTISKVVVKVNGLSHSYARDIDMLLVGPGGQRALLMSDTGGSTVITNASLTFDAAAAVGLPLTQITTGTYKPTNNSIGSADSFPTQLLTAPATTYPTDLNVFNGTSPNGTWKLYVLDDAAVDSGTIAAGFSLTITTASSTGNLPPVVTNPGAQMTPVNTSAGLQIIASDPNGNVLAFSATGLPPGLAINSATGLISGTATTAGSFTSTVTVNDGQGGVTNASFAWTVVAGNASTTQTFTASAAITITDNTTSSPYPANLAVAGMSGTISKVVVKVNGLSHSYARDIDMLLVGPGGQRAMLMSDTGGSTVITNASLTFDAAAAVGLPLTQITTGTYKPTDNSIGPVDSFPTQLLTAPATTYPTDLNVFNGTSPNGTWKLYVLDDAAVDSGTIAAGFSLTITTQ